MSTQRSLSVPARVRNTPHISSLSHLPANVLLHPRALAAPVAQGAGPGRNPAGVVSLRLAEIERYIVDSERRKLIEEIETLKLAVENLRPLAAHMQHSITCARRRLAELGKQSGMEDSP